MAPKALICLILLAFSAVSLTNCSSSGSGDSTETEGLNTISGQNGFIDFDNLVAGDAYTLTAPDPTEGQIATVFQTAILSDDCSCLWAISPASAGSFDDFQDCITILTVEDVVCDVDLSVLVDCGELGKEHYMEDVCVTGGTASESLDELSADTTCNINDNDEACILP